MPYVERTWYVGDVEVPEGTWVPERNWESWNQRAQGVAGGELTWRRAPSDADPASADVPRLSDDALKVLAGDLADAQFDAFLYQNMIERLKNDLSDQLADDIVEQMRTLGMASADWLPVVGGPPRRESPRVAKKVLNWLLRLAAKAAKFVLECTEAAVSALTGVLSSVHIGFTVPPHTLHVAFGFETAILANPGAWQRARGFFEAQIKQLDANFT